MVRAVNIPESSGKSNDPEFIETVRVPSEYRKPAETNEASAGDVSERFASEHANCI